MMQYRLQLLGHEIDLRAETARAMLRHARRNNQLEMYTRLRGFVCYGLGRTPELRYTALISIDATTTNKTNRR